VLKQNNRMKEGEWCEVLVRVYWAQLVRIVHLLSLIPPPSINCLPPLPSYVSACPFCSISAKNHARESLENKRKNGSSWVVCMGQWSDFFFFVYRWVRGMGVFSVMSSVSERILSKRKYHI
jgi:hypothetical protein